MGEYEALGKENFFPRPDTCPYCRRPGVCLIGHGFYSRYAVDFEAIHRIVIKVWRCKRSGRSISVHPDFLIPHRQYLLSVVIQALILHLLFRLSLRGSLETAFLPAVRPPFQTLQNWVRDFRSHCDFWLGILRSRPEKASCAFRPDLPLPPADDRAAEALHLFCQLAAAAPHHTPGALHAALYQTIRGSPFRSGFPSR